MDNLFSDYDKYVKKENLENVIDTLIKKHRDSLNKLAKRMEHDENFDINTWFNDLNTAGQNMEIMNYIENNALINKMEKELLIELANDKNDDNSEVLDIFYDMIVNDLNTTLYIEKEVNHYDK